MGKNFIGIRKSILLWLVSFGYCFLCDALFLGQRKDRAGAIVAGLKCPFCEVKGHGSDHMIPQRPHFRHTCCLRCLRRRRFSGLIYPTWLFRVG